ncbi:MAG: 16S rRNA (cytosine(967)-C(5))-methyltransferase RsmB [Candidatus Acidiferrales bacterium]
MVVSVARAIAFDILSRVESEQAYASDLLHAELDGADGSRASAIKRTDAALAMELTLGVLRWRRLLDFLLSPWLKKPVDRLDLPVAIALRMGVYQLRFLTRVPASAAVNESVELVKRAKKPSAAALVNAVLRRAAEQTSPPESGRAALVHERTAHIREISLSDNQIASLNGVDRIATLHSHPTWLVERWLARFGEQRTIDLLEADNRPPCLSLVLREPDRRDDVLAALDTAGLDVQPGALLGNALAVGGGSPARTQAFRDGLISIQDEASQAIPLLLDVRCGDRVLDLCAAPGGKTPPLARAAGNGVVVAADRHAHRLRGMQAQFERLRLENVGIVELDAEQPLPFAEQFNRILVDAPCSGTGTLARHPEIRWRLRPEQLIEFHRLQVAILSSALATLAPGGRLVYSTCSLEPEENEFVIREVLRGASNARSSTPSNASISLVLSSRTIAALAPHLATGVAPGTLFDSDGFFRTVPGVQPTDGFFAAILEKKSGAR